MSAWAGRGSPWRTDYLISGWPWGWGATKCRGWQAGDKCERCGRKLRKSEGGPLFVDDQWWCVECARTVCMERYTACPLYGLMFAPKPAPEGQLELPI